MAFDLFWKQLCVLLLLLLLLPPPWNTIIVSAPKTPNQPFHFLYIAWHLVLPLAHLCPTAATKKHVAIAEAGSNCVFMTPRMVQNWNIAKKKIKKLVMETASSGKTSQMWLLMFSTLISWNMDLYWFPGSHDKLTDQYYLFFFLQVIRQNK